MRVQINPDRKVDGEPLQVRHPVTGVPFPAGPFDLSDSDLANPDIRRLLPRGHGGAFGDLVPVVPVPAVNTKGGGK